MRGDSTAMRGTTGLTLAEAPLCLEPAYTRFMQARKPVPPAVRLRVGLVAIAIAIATAAALAASSAQRARSQIGGGMDTISPSVIENLFAHEEPDGSWRLDLLVLWRGDPGWFLAGGANGMSSSDRSDGSSVLHNRHADVDFDITFDPAAGLATLAGTTIRLDETNVVLVDGMPSAMKIVATRRVNNRIARPPIGLQAVFRASPELDDFLRCNVTNGNPVLEYFRAPCTWGPPK